MYENMVVIDREAPESLQKQIRRQIAIGIVNRQYLLHQPLPSIRQLSSELSVSVTTGALAYEALKQDGFVEARNRSGFYVNQDVLIDPGHAIKADGTDAAILRDRVQAEGVFFETGGFTFSDERSNRNHIRLGYSVIGDSLIPEGIDKIAKAVPDARVVEPAPEEEESES